MNLTPKQLDGLMAYVMEAQEDIEASNYGDHNSNEKMVYLRAMEEAIENADENGMTIEQIKESINYRMSEWLEFLDMEMNLEIENALKSII